MEKDWVRKHTVKFEDIKYNRKSLERVLTGFKDLDFYIKGIGYGLTILLADTNMGKSIMTSMFLRKAIEQGYKCGVFASEHTAESYKMLTMQQNAQKGEFDLVPFVDKNGNETNIADWYVNENSEKRTNEMYNGNLFLYNNVQPERDIDSLTDWIGGLYVYCGVRFFVIDNFMEITSSSYDMNSEQTNILTKLRDTALNCKEPLFIVLVQHTNKESVRDTFRLTVKSGSGTSNSGNKAYNVVALYRKDCIAVKKGNEKSLETFKSDCAKCGFDFDSCDSFLEVLKTKGNGNGIIGLKYDQETKTFSQSNKISKTQADVIQRRILKQNSEQEKMDWSSMNKLDDETSKLLDNIF